MVIMSLAVTNYAVYDQIDSIKVALSRKHWAIHLCCNCEKGSAGHSLATPALDKHWSETGNFNFHPP